MNGTKNWIIVAVLLLPIAAANPAYVAAQSGEREPGRYSMTPTDDGFLRLDTLTGAVSMCQKSGQGWRCTSVDDDQLALQSEIERLRRENAKLRAQALLPPPSDGRPQPPGKKLELPSKEEIDKAMSFLEDLLRRFKGVMQDLPPTDEGTPL